MSIRDRVFKEVIKLKRAPVKTKPPQGTEVPQVKKRISEDWDYQDTWSDADRRGGGLQGGRARPQSDRSHCACSKNP